MGDLEPGFEKEPGVFEHGLGSRAPCLRPPCSWRGSGYGPAVDGQLGGLTAGSAARHVLHTVAGFVLAIMRKAEARTMESAGSAGPTDLPQRANVIAAGPMGVHVHH